MRRYSDSLRVVFSTAIQFNLTIVKHVKEAKSLGKLPGNTKLIGATVPSDIVTEFVDNGSA